MSWYMRHVVRPSGKLFYGQLESGAVVFPDLGSHGPQSDHVVLVVNRALPRAGPRH